MLELVRGNPTRLAVLLDRDGRGLRLHGARGVGDPARVLGAQRPITLNGALAVETFSRVASFASAFIPANLGALEASSLAAVAAVGAVGGGAALALARRLRGLFWAGLGLAIYPRGARAQRSVETRRARPAAPRPPSDAALSPARRGGRGPAVGAARRAAARRARAPRRAQRAGYTRIDRLAAETAREPGRTPDRALRQTRCATVGGRVTVATTSSEWRDALRAPRAVRIRDGHRRRHGRLAGAPRDGARDLPSAPDDVRDVPAGPDWPESGVLALTRGDRRRSARVAVASSRAPARSRAAAAVRRGCRRRAAPGSRCASTTPADLADAEQTIRRSSYKDTDAKIARFNRRISLPISVALIPHAAHREPALGDARRDRLLLGVAVQHRALPGRACSARSSRWPPACSTAATARSRG